MVRLVINVSSGNQTADHSSFRRKKNEKDLVRTNVQKYAVAV